jgi:serine/threonine-protein kinase
MKCPSCQAENRTDSRFCHQCATPLPQEGTPAEPVVQNTLLASFDDLKRGSLFAGRYEVIEELGKGGMGKVYRVFDQKLNEAVALKLIKPEIGFNEKAIQRFKNELKLARKIAHRHVCRLYDLGEAGLVHFLTMEYVEGEDLKAFIRRAGPIATARSVTIAHQIAEGLAEAHRLGVVHRDLKPQNVMIDREGHAKIMDFGLARFMEADGFTGTGVMLGTPEYMSPEQVDLKDVDGRSDIYALGVILYEMVTGRVPFAGETPLSVAIKQKNELAPDVRDTNPLVPEALARIVARCLEKAPAARFQTAEDLIVDLDRLAGELPSVVREMSRSITPQGGSKTAAGVNGAKGRFTGRRRLVFAVPTVALILVASYFLLLHKSPSTRPTPHDPKMIMVKSPAPPSDAAGQAGRIFSRWMDPKIVKEELDSKDLEKALDEVKVYLPEKGPYVEAWNKVSETIRRSQGSENMGRAATGSQAQKLGPAPQAMRGDMQQLLSMVAERQSAQKAMDDMAAMRGRVSGRISAERNFLYRVARFEEGNANDAFAKNDYSGARALYRLLGRIYAASPKGESGKEGVEALRSILASVRTEAGRVPADKVDSWLSSTAKEIETQAEAFAAKNEFENAGGAFVRAAFLYEKIKDAALPAT